MDENEQEEKKELSDWLSPANNQLANLLHPMAHLHNFPGFTSSRPKVSWKV